MGTMSRYQGRYQGKRHEPKRAVLAVRTLSEAGSNRQLLKDCLTVIHHREKFNRNARRFVWSIWQRHAASLGLSVVDALKKFEHVTVVQDSIGSVQRRLLALARKI